MQKELITRSSNDYPSLIGFRTTMVIKRAFDIILSLIALILLIPFFVIISIIVFFDMKANPIFLQTRLGKNNKPFRIVKFRTMLPDTPNKSTCELDDPDKYITKIGGVLRRLSIDELPQLFNILFGQMSFVGPRPVIPGDTYTFEQRTRTGASNVRPGLTGLAQISGRDTVSVEDRAKLDAFYANNVSVSLDVSILFKTVGYVLRGEGIQEGKMDNDKK